MIEQFLNVSRWGLKVRAIFGIDGADPVRTLDQLRPVAVIECDREEWGFAGAERSGGMLTQQAAVAGEFSVIGIVNPIDSGVLTVVRLVRNYSANLVNLKLGRLTEFTANAPIDVNVPSLETREWNMSAAAAATLAPRIATFIRRGSNVAALPLANGWFTHNWLNPLPALGPPDQVGTPWFVALRPGMVLAMEGTAVNTIVQMTFIVRERPIESALAG